MPSELVFSIITIGVLLLMSGFFSGSETALTAASRARMHRLATEGDRKAAIVMGLIDDSPRLIGGILLGNNLVNILSSALATSVLIQLTGDRGVIWATLIMTALVLIFAEVLPKTYAITRPDQVSLSVARPIALLTRLLSPIVLVVQRIVTLTLRAVGVDISEQAGFLSPREEIRGAIDLHAHEGGLGIEHRDMLGSILDLDEVFVEDVMIHRSSIFMINADDPPAKIVKQVIRSAFTRIPLYRGDTENIVGILHAKDLLRALNRPGARPETLKIDRIATDPWFVPETTTLREQLNAFLARKSHFALVVDEYGALMGLVTLEDILEEIVGEIADEYDEEDHTPGIDVDADGAVTVEGTVTIRDLNRHMDWSLPDEDATTIAGLVIDKAQVIPVKGQAFEFEGMRFEVLERRRNQLTRIRITPLAAGDATPPPEGSGS